MSLLEIRGLVKNFGGLLALSEFSLAMEAGEVVGIIGPNGAGKTTAFNCITGFVSLDAGSVTLDGKSLSGKKPYEIVNHGLTRTWQLVRPFFGMKVIEALQIPSFCPRARASTKDRHELERRILAIADSLGLAGKLDDDVDNLNQGQLRLLDIARAMVTNPLILLLDEPFSGLSHREIGQISSVVKDFNEQGLGVVIIEHRLRELMKLVKRVVVINFGSKIAEGAPDEVVRDPQVVKAYLGTKGDELGLA
jgi:branched-chain amino acid transport system ATP-binding protein